MGSFNDSSGNFQLRFRRLLAEKSPGSLQESPQPVPPSAEGTQFSLSYIDRFYLRIRKDTDTSRKKEKEDNHFLGLQIIKIVCQESILPGRNLREAKKSLV